MTSLHTPSITAAPGAWPTVKHLTEAQIDKVTHANAMRFFSFDLFKDCKREDLTAGALRARAVAAGVVTTPKSSGGAAPLRAGEMVREVTSGDVVAMFSKHADAA